MRHYYLLCGAALFGMSATAMAQDAATSGNAQPSVAEIVVTAQRRAEKLVDVPVSVNALSNAELATRHIDSLGDLTQAVTSLRFEGQAPSFEPTLRGIGTLVQGGGVDASVAVYVDGVYLPNSYGMNFNLPNISSIDVLKGPQGTLFGRNTTGGAIQINTAAPSFTWTGDVKATYASFDDRRMQGYVSGPLTNDIAFSISGYYRQSDGYMINLAANGTHDLGVKMFNIRPSLLFDNHDNLKIRLIYEHGYSSDISELGLVNVDGYAVARGIPGALISSSFPYFAADTLPINTTKADAFTGIVDLKLGDTTSLKSVTSYRTDSNQFASDADMSNIPLEWVTEYTTFKTFSEELTVAHKAGRLDVVGGVSYYNSLSNSPYTTIDGLAATGICGAASCLIAASKIKSESEGAFADATYEIADRLFVTVGARYSTEHKAFDLYGGVLPDETDGHRWNAFTPRGVVRYQLDQGDNIYASYSRGFKPGAYAGFPPNLVAPEHVSAYETGYKHASSLFDLTAAAYYYQYTNFQVTTFNFTTGLGQTINAPAERSYGFELETTLRPTRQWRISASGAYLNAKFTNFPNATIEVANGYGQWVPAPQTATGTIVPRSPKWSGNASTSYDVATGFGQLRLAANLSFASSLYNLINQQFANPAYAEVGLNAMLTPNEGHWTAEVFVTNLTDKHLYAQYQGGPVGTYALFQAPRVIGGSISYHF
jgi:iron complex outermembrane recepter protein